MNSSAFNKLCAGRQFSVSNPPQRKAANRYASCLGDSPDLMLTARNEQTKK